MSPAELAAIAAGGALGWTAAGRPKAQAVRLLDVWLLGPLMIYVAATADDRDAGEVPLAALLATGAATITYNGRNYLRSRNPYLGPG